MRVKALLLVAIGVALVALPATAKPKPRGKPDLVVRSVSVSASSVERTAGFAVTVVLKNAAKGKARASKTALYLSRKRQKAKRAVALAPKEAVPALKGRAGATGTVTLTVPSPTALRAYFVVACADAARKVAERNEKNNCKAASTRVTVTRAQQPPAGKTATSLIDAAIAGGKISAETGLTYKLFASFRDPRLPPEYRGIPSPANESLLSRVGDEFGSLSPKTQAAVRPFFAAPFAPGSWWTQHEGIATPAGSTSALLPQDEGVIDPCIRSLGPLTGSWSFVDTKNGGARVWWETSNAADAGRARTFADALDKDIWLRLVSLMGRAPLPDGGSSALNPCRGGDDRLDISLVHLADVGWDGLTSPIDWTCHDPSPAVILLNSGATVDHLAHEVMHAIQRAFPRADCASYRWLSEATANWAMDYVYPTHNVEQSSAFDFLSTPNLPLEKIPGGDSVRQYGAYLLPFFLARSIPGGETLIRTIWENAGSNADSLQAIDKAIPGGFTKQWPLFARDNWNKDNVDYYDQWDPGTPGIPSAFSSDLDGTVSDNELGFGIDGTGNAIVRPNVTMDHLTSRYFDFNFSGSAAKTLALDSFMTDPGHIEALGQIGGAWLDLGDWSISLAPQQFFCRELDEERLSRLVLIVSNSSTDTVLNPDAYHPPTLVGTNIGCKQWSGSFSGTAKQSSTASGMSLSYTQTWSGNGVFTRDDKFPTTLRLLSGSVTWSETGTLDFGNGATCTVAAGPATLTASPGDGYVELGVTNVQNPRAYRISIGHVDPDGVPGVESCPDQSIPFTAHPDPLWLTTSGTTNEPNVAPGGTLASGDYHQGTTPANDWAYDWHWNFAAQ